MNHRLIKKCTFNIKSNDSLCDGMLLTGVFAGNLFDLTGTGLGG